MNRLCHTIPDLETLLAARSDQDPVDALLVSGDGLARIFRRELAELHERRRLVAGTPAEAETLQAITYWQEALAWIQPHRRGDLVLSVRRAGS